MSLHTMLCDNNTYKFSEKEQIIYKSPDNIQHESEIVFFRRLTIDINFSDIIKKSNLKCRKFWIKRI